MTKDRQGGMSYNDHIYRFDRKKMAWKSTAVLKYPCISPHLVLSANKEYIYIMGGDIDQGVAEFRVSRFNL